MSMHLWAWRVWWPTEGGFPSGCWGKHCTIIGQLQDFPNIQMWNLSASKLKLKMLLKPIVRLPNKHS